MILFAGSPGRSDPIKTDYGHVLQVYESSAADGPHVWLAVSALQTANGEVGKLHAHMTVEQALKLRDALDAVVANHYQNED